MTTYIQIGVDAVDASQVTKPGSRSFRNAWALDADKEVISVDMTMAKAIQRDVIRAERLLAFATNDIAINDALLSGDADAVAAAITRRDALRNAPAHSSITNAANAANVGVLAAITLDDVT